MALPKIQIDPIVHQEVMHYVRASDIEVSGFGLVEPIAKGGDTVFRVHRAYLFPQKGTGASSICYREAVQDLETDLFREGFDLGLRWWWHSHVDMAVFFSGTDSATMAEVSDAWMTATVFNSKGEMFSCYQQGGAVPLYLSALQTEVALPQPSKAVVDGWAQNLAKNVRKHEPLASYSSHMPPHFGGKGSGYGDSGFGSQEAFEEMFGPVAAQVVKPRHFYDAKDIEDMDIDELLNGGLSEAQLEHEIVQAKLSPRQALRAARKLAKRRGGK